MSLLQVKSRFLGWREWEVNPVVLKELRQGVRSRVFGGMLMVLLVLVFLGSVASLAGEGARWGGSPEIGRNMFDACLAVLALCTLVFIPAYVGLRVAREQHQADLTLFTPLSIPRLVRGKFMGGLYIAGLLFSVCVPFMTLSALLQGPDWLTIPFVLVVLWLSTAEAILAALTLAVLPMRPVVKWGFGICFIGGLAGIYVYQVKFFFQLVRSGVAPLLKSPGFFTIAAALLGLGVLAALTFYSFAKTHIVREGRRDRLSPEPFKSN